MTPAAGHALLSSSHSAHACAVSACACTAALAASAPASDPMASPPCGAWAASPEVWVPAALLLLAA